MASGASDPPSEERELSLLDRVELRIALAETDNKLQALLKTYLVPVLVKLTSPHLKVRNKVISICQHVNTRIEAPNIELPALALINQLKQHGDSQLLRHFNVRFVRRALSRVTSQNQREELLQGILKDIAPQISPPSAIGAYLFHFLLRILSGYKFPRRGDKDDLALRESLNIQDADGDALSWWFGKLLLLPAKAVTSQDLISASGLSKTDLDFLTLPEIQGAWNPDSNQGLNFMRTKSLVLDFVETGAFSDAEKLWPFLFAISDTNPTGIVDRGNEYVKFASRVDIEDKALVQRLYEVYLGTSDGPTGSTPSASITLCTRILTLLVRSKMSASSSFGKQLAQVLEQGLVDGASGLPAARFNAAFVNFIVHAFRLSDQSELGAMGESLISTLRDFVVTNQGWPSPEPGADLLLRGKLYELIGLAAKEGHIADLDLLVWLLASLNEDTSGKEVLLSVEEAISAITQAFAKNALSANQRDALGHVLVDLLTRQPTTTSAPRHRSLLFILARLANRCLPYNDVTARYVDILVIGAPGRTFEATEEGRKGLDPFWFKMVNSHRPDLWSSSQDKSLAPVTGSVLAKDFNFPDFASLSRRIFPFLEAGTQERDVGAAARHIADLSRKMSESFAPMIKYCYRILLAQALSSDGTSMVDESWERTMDSLISKDASKRKTLQTYLSASERSPLLVQALEGLILSGLRAFSMNKSSEILDCQGILVQILSASPDKYRRHFEQSFGFTDVLAALNSGDRLTRSLAARAFGILFSQAASATLEDSNPLTALSTLASSWKTAVGPDVDEVSGSIEGIANASGRLGYQGPLPPVVDSATQKLHAIISSVIMKSTDTTLLDASYSAIGQLGIWLTYGNFLKFPVPAVGSDSPEITAAEVVEKIAAKANGGNEKAIVALGRFSIWLKEDEDDAVLQLIYTKLYECHEVRQTETQFAVGEALCCVAFGSDNSAIQSEFDTTGDSPIGPPREKMLNQVLEKTLKGCRESKPSLRRSSVIWLLSLIEFGGHHSAVQQRLTECQSAFKYCLGDRDELVQEASARGLGLVYERGDRQIKDALVQDLIASFSDNKAKLGGTVTEDTQLFDEGALKTNDGSISTYKDILSLASEIGDPSLVYRFMSLAANNAIWTSRAAFGKFGLTNVFSDSSVDGYLSKNPKMYPVLYRYQFDPNPNVQRSMKVLWQSLVKDPSAILDKHFDAIMQELLKSILGREWRSREATCRAIADLVQDRKFDKYEKYLAEIWSSCSKVMDDIKGSVRAAGQSLARTLSGILVRNLEAGESLKSTGAMLDHVLPFLLSPSGVEAKAEEVQGWAVSTLLLIIKKSRGSVLEPHVPTLIESLISLFSSLEPAIVNYVHINAAKYNMTAQDIDDLRLKVTVKQSPLMEGVEKLLDATYSKPETTDKVAAAVEKAARSSLGMPSLAATSRVMVTMFVRYQVRFKPYADRLLKSIEKPIVDRNETVSSSYAYASGYIARYATDQGVMKISDFAWKLWCTSENDRHRAVTAEIFQAISKHAPERFAALSDRLLPFVFVGKHDDQEEVKETFQKTWSDSTSGPRVIILHLKAMVDLAVSLLDDPKWRLKHAGAKAIAEATESVAGLDKLVSPGHAPTVWPALVKALAGKSWEGKEVVLQALAKFVEDVKPFWEKDQAVRSEVTKIILREARRQNRGYQRYAYPVLGRIATARTDLDLSSTVLEIVCPEVDELTANQDDMDVDGDEDKVKDSLRDEILSGAIFAGQGSIGPLSLKSDTLPAHVITFLDSAAKANSVQNRVVTTSAFEALERLFEKLADPTIIEKLKPKEAAFVDKVAILLFQVRYEALGGEIKLKRAKAVSALARIPWASAKREILAEKLDEETVSEPVDAVREELKKAKAALS